MVVSGNSCGYGGMYFRLSLSLKLESSQTDDPSARCIDMRLFAVPTFLLGLYMAVFVCTLDVLRFDC